MKICSIKHHVINPTKSLEVGDIGEVRRLESEGIVDVPRVGGVGCDDEVERRWNLVLIGAIEVLLNGS